MSKNMTLDFVALLRAWSIEDPALLRMGRLLLLDGLAVALAGSDQPGPSLAGALARTQGGNLAATVIGQGFSTSPSQAAQINGMSMHVLDYEPMWNPPNHALSTMLPGLLALAEQREASGAGPQGERLLRALLKGIEAQGRLRLSSGQIEPRELSLHPPGVVGPLACAIACAEFLDLPEAQHVAALGIAASRAGGVLANVGSMTKALHCGDACRSGLEAALLAQSGFTADADALSGPRGYAHAYFGDRFDASHLLAPLLVPRVITPGPAWKLFPSQYATHFAITAALDCRAQLTQPEKIQRVEILTPLMPYIDRPNPTSGLDGKFSLQYCVVAALLDARLNLDSFSDERRFAEDATRLLSVTQLTQTAEISGRFDAMHVEVCVTLVDGTVIRHRCASPLGSWSRPIAAEVIETKAHDLIDRRILPTLAERFWSELQAPTQDLSISTLMRCLAAEQSHN